MRQIHSKLTRVIAITSVMLIAAVSRLWNLGYPNRLVFDETYYVKDALTQSAEGHEKSWPDGADAAFESGEVFGYLPEAAFTVHPPLGKWLIAAGMWIVGPDQSSGWRLSTALLGIATVALLMLVAYKLFKSVAMAVLSGLLLAVDGLAITLSRTALLDSSLTFFLLLGFWFFLLDQQRLRPRITLAINQAKESVFWFRPWLILAGISLGAASSIKWSGLYLLAGIGIYLVVSETLLRRDSGELHFVRNGIGFQGIYSFLSLVPAAIGTYLLTWLGWILSSGGYARNWAIENPQTGVFGWLPNWMQSLWHYHQVIYNFHIGLTKDHPYEAHPLGWLIGIRPTAFFYESYPLGENDCQIAAGCSSAITALGNPLIWFGSTLALGYLAYRYAKNRERVIGLILLGVASLYLPWLLLSERTVFQFYSVSFQPWMILALVLVLQQLRARIRIRSVALADSFVVAVVFLTMAMSLFFYPINSGGYLPFELWQLRMWLPSWV